MKNTIDNYWFTVGTLILGGLLARVLVHLVLTGVKRLTSKTKSTLDDNVITAADTPLGWFACFLIWRISTPFLMLPEIVTHYVDRVTEFALTLTIIWVIIRILDVLSDTFKAISSRSNGLLDAHLISVLHKVFRMTAICLGGLLLAQNMGYNVKSILAGLGLGGLAFALAAKDTCANIFGSLSIFIDRPFKIGDYISVDGHEGTVEEVGLRSTRIRTFYDSQISIPNAQIANVMIDNFGRRTYRRVKFTVGVVYHTPADKIETFVSGIKRLILTHPDTRKDYFHVVFNEFGTSSLNLMLYFFVKVDNWSDELRVRQDINLEIIKLAKSEGVSFAFPSRSVYVESNETL